MDESLAALCAAIRRSYADHPGYQHQFWEWFASGAFDVRQLRRFALAYYEHVRTFRLYIAGALTIAPTEELQRVLATNLADEYAVGPEASPDESHPALFRRFMRSLDLTELDWEGQDPISGIEKYQQLHFALFRGGLVSETIGAVVFGMESTTPYRHGRVVAGLRRYEQRRDGAPVDTYFWEVHSQSDDAHSQQLVDACTEFIKTDPDGVARGARLSFDGRKLFLDDLARHVGMHADR